MTLVGGRDLRQCEHAVRRNYPIFGNIRYMAEGIRPEIRQYLLEGDQHNAYCSMREPRTRWATSPSVR